MDANGERALGRLSSPLQQRHDELERLQEALRSMPTGGRAVRSGAAEVGCSDAPQALRADPHCAREAAVAKARHVFGEVMASGDSRRPSAHSAADTLIGVGDAGCARRFAFGDDIVGAVGGSGHQQCAPRPRENFRGVASEDPLANVRRIPLAHTSTSSSHLMNELRTVCPLLSASFSCTDADATVLLNTISSSGSAVFAGGGHGYGRDGVGSGAMASLEDRCATLEAEVRQLTARLERRDEECDRLRDSLGEARQRTRAIEAAAKQQQTLMSQRREESRKNLLTEEGRSAKLAHQNKLLQQEMDKLKARLLSAPR